MKRSLHILLALVFCCLTACVNQQENVSISPHIISVEDAKNIFEQESNWVLFEISKEEKYQKGHIAGAHRLWRPDYCNEEAYEFGGMRASKSQLERLLSQYGVKNDSKILLYDTKGNVDATRFAWQLELFGFHNFYLINGGKKAWELTNYELTTKLPSSPSTSNFKFEQISENQSFIAHQKEVWEAIQDTQTILVDTRELYEFRGEPFKKNGQKYPFKKGAYANGAIPNALHFNWSNTVDLSNDHCLKSISTIKYDLEKAGISPNKKIIVYCQSGVRSAHTSFVLRHLLNYPHVKNYDGSWIEWTYEAAKNNQNAPIHLAISDSLFQKMYDDL